MAGVRTGSGTLYNSVGSKVFQGSFLGGEIVYHDFLTRPTSEVPELYSGETAVYQSDEEYCVTMPEIDAVYAVKDGSNTLENEWTVDRVYVLHGSVPLESGTCTTLRQLMAAMGEPLYFGTAWVDLPEAVAWDLVAEEQPDRMDQVRIESTASFENILFCVQTALPARKRRSLWRILPRTTDCGTAVSLYPLLSAGHCCRRSCPSAV